MSAALDRILADLDAEQIADAGQPAFITMSFQVDMHGGAMTCQQFRKLDGSMFESLSDGPVVSEYFDYAENTDEPVESRTFPTLRAALEEVTGETITANEG